MISNYIKSLTTITTFCDVEINILIMSNVMQKKWTLLSSDSSNIITILITNRDSMGMLYKCISMDGKKGMKVVKMKSS